MEKKKKEISNGTKEDLIKSHRFCPSCCPELDPTPENRPLRLIRMDEMCRECSEGWKPVRPKKDWTPWTPPDGWENHNVIGRQSLEDLRDRLGKYLSGDEDLITDGDEDVLRDFFKKYEEEVSV